MVFVLLIGWFVIVWGECCVLLIEYVGFVIVFFVYGGIYYFGWGVLIVVVFYVFDYLFFVMVLVLKIYF